MDVSLSLESGTALLLIPLTLGFVIFVYGRTHPIAEGKLRVALVVVRSIAMAILILLIAEPVMGLLSKKVVRPVVAILMDVSGSMATLEGRRSRIGRIKQVVGGDRFQEAFSGAQIAAFGFAEEAFPVQLADLEAITTRGRSTDIAGAIRGSVRQLPDPKALKSILLISDGGHNQGEDPARVANDLGTPVYVLHVGEDDLPADIQITKAEAPEIGYFGQSMTVEATVLSSGFGGSTARVLLYDGENVIGRKTVALSDRAVQAEVSFDVLSDAIGPRFLRVAIPTVESESSSDNNGALVFTRILAEKVHVALVAGAPGPDLSFLRRSLESDSTIATKTFVQKKPGEYYHGVEDLQKELAGAEVIVLLNPDGDMMGGLLGSRVRDRVESGVGLLFAAGRKTYREWSSSNTLTQLLPVGGPASSFVMRPVKLRITAEGEMHPVVRPYRGSQAGPQRAALSDDRPDSWKRLPPLPGYFPLAQLAPGATVLAKGEKNEAPLIVAGRFGRGKVITLVSSDYWRLDLLSSGAGSTSSTIRRFWRNAVKWLAVSSPHARLQVSAEREIYKGGEEIAIVGRVFDELMRPIEGAEVRAVIAERAVSVPFRDVGDGRYRATLRGLSSGNYRFKVEAHLEDELIGTDEGRFAVEEYSVEAVSVLPNRSLLSDIASISGGRAKPLDEWPELVEAMQLKKRIVKDSSVISMREQEWLIAIVTILLAAEWFVRKSHGMI